jgi:UDP-glucuronate 4-epimerase
MNASLLVTGGAGFIGSHLVERLIQRGYRVVCLDNFDPYYSPSIKRENIRKALSTGQVHLVEADIRDPDALRPVFARDSFRAIIHLAARVGVRHSLEDPATYLDVNATGTFNLLSLSREFAIPRFILGSTSSVYGLLDGAAAREDFMPCRPLSPYGASKVAAEALCCAYAHAFGLCVVALRFFTVYGPRQRPDMAINRFTRLIASGEEVPIYGDGNSLRDYTYVADIVNGIESALETPLEGFQVFNLGQGRPVRLLQLVGLIEEALGAKAELRFMPQPAGDPPLTWADLDKAGGVLGYRPEVPIDRGIPLYVQWFKEAQPA